MVIVPRPERPPVSPEVAAIVWYVLALFALTAVGAGGCFFYRIVNP